MPRQPPPGDRQRLRQLHASSATPPSSPDPAGSVNLGNAGRVTGLRGGRAGEKGETGELWSMEERKGVGALIFSGKRQENKACAWRTAAAAGGGRMDAGERRGKGRRRGGLVCGAGEGKSFSIGKPRQPSPRGL